jgi:phenylpyruvate tautomerase PptA (4-oxalocrotonate tautomerase family)
MPTGSAGGPNLNLMETLTRTLLRWEGAKPGNAAAESIAWTFVHEPARITVAGAVPHQPRYRVVVGVPQGSLDDDTKAGLVAEVTDQVLRAETNGRPPNPADRSRVWVIVNEIAEGNWGGSGRIFRLRDILALTGADPEQIDRRTARLHRPVPAGTNPSPHG